MRPLFCNGKWQPFRRAICNCRYYLLYSALDFMPRGDASISFSRDYGRQLKSQPQTLAKSITPSVILRGFNARSVFASLGNGQPHKPLINKVIYNRVSDIRSVSLISAVFVPRARECSTDCNRVWGKSPVHLSHFSVREFRLYLFSI